MCNRISRSILFLFWNDGRVKKIQLWLFSSQRFFEELTNKSIYLFSILLLYNLKKIDELMSRVTDSYTFHYYKALNWVPEQTTPVFLFEWLETVNIDSTMLEKKLGIFFKFLNKLVLSCLNLYKTFIFFYIFVFQIL